MDKVGRSFAALLILGMSEILLVSPASAKTVTLSCRAVEGSGTYALRFNDSSGLVEELGDSGVALTGSATASISENAIKWSIDYPSSYRTGDGVSHQTTAHWEGRIDRLSGNGWFARYFEGRHPNPVSVSCNEAAQKF